MERDASPTGQSVRRRAGPAPVGHAAPASVQAAERPPPARVQHFTDMPDTQVGHDSGKKLSAGAAKPAPSSVAEQPGQDWFERNETATAIIVFIIAAISRFYRLDQPRGVVFDEVRAILSTAQ